MITGSRKRQHGTEVVEFAVTAMLLFTLLFGIIEFSVALFDKQTITNAAREGARTGILFRPGPRELTSEDDAIREAINNYAADYLISLGGPAEMDIDIQRTMNGGTFGLGDELTVTVTYPYQFLIIPEFVGNAGNGIALTSTTVMRAE